MGVKRSIYRRTLTLMAFRSEDIRALGKVARDSVLQFHPEDDKYGFL